MSVLREKPSHVITPKRMITEAKTDPSKGARPRER